MPISFRGWIEEFRTNWAEESLKRATLQAIWTLFLGVWLTMTSRVELGTNVYEREWDALIILDACRTDALQTVAPEYDFLDSNEISSMWSVGSGSLEFMCKTFTPEYEDDISNTTYLAANGYINIAFVDQEYAPPVSIPFGFPKEGPVSADAFNELTNVMETRFDDALRNVPSSEMTDAAIGAGRRNDADRLILHYSQPHTPYIANAVAEGRSVTEDEHKPWPSLQDGSLSYETVWEWYLDNLRLVLDQVAVLLENLDVETVAITADHGEAFGDWRIHGHPTGFPLPPVKTVPWVTTTATDTRDHQYEAVEDEVDNCATVDDEAVEEQLQSLGYI
jgi:hypothetical protein